jgi:transcriptional regulator with XRE-family HTH domain
MNYANATWQASRTAGTVGTQPASPRNQGQTPDLMGILATNKITTAQALADFQDAITQHMQETSRKESIGRRLRELRMRSPYTQEKVAELIDVSLRGYQKMEQSGGIRYQNLEQLADLFSVDVDYFFQDDEQPGADRLDEAIRLLHDNQDLMRQILRRLEAVVPPLSEAEALQAYEQAVVDGDRAQRAPKRAAGKRSAATRSRPA